jgi:hypothetical protein
MTKPYSTGDTWLAWLVVVVLLTIGCFCGAAGTVGALFVGGVL